MTDLRLDYGVRGATPDDLAGLHELRHRVFVVEQGVPADIEVDAADTGAVHVLAATADGDVLGTGRYVVRGGHAVVGRMAVAARARGAGVGTALLRRLEVLAADAGLGEVRLHAQASAEGFYRRAGYAVTGQEFVEAGIEHVPMAKALPVIREAADTDAQALAGLIALTWAAYPNCVLDVAGEEPWLLAPRTSYDEAGGTLWVVTLDGRVVGCGGVKWPGGAELKSLYVAASARRHGIAGRLVRRVEEAARLSGAAIVGLWSDSRFVEAHAFYARQGYAPTGATRDLHDRSGTTEHEFTKLLD